MLPDTTQRVPVHTSEEVNARIRLRMEENVAHCAAAGTEAIERRLFELDREWDIERMLEANASALALVGLGMGAFVDRRFFALPAIVMGFLLQHALQGWCPPVPVLRRLGFRTQTEIDEERYALKVLRGDFKAVEPRNAADGRELRRLMYAVRR
ncbi:MAG TPA: hypothetical protein VFP00_11785 [Burkholderiales bacterium]|nr:hypothetical protein [Burkholderiales bacterium]